MAEKTLIAQLVEKVVSQVLDKHVSHIREELVHRVLEEVQGEMVGAGATDGAGAADLLLAVSAIHAGTTQKEVLRALLENTVRYSGRSALFVVKSGTATGWQGCGFDNHASIKDFVLDMASRAPSMAIELRSAVKAPVGEMDPKFIAQFGAPAQSEILLLPLHLKDKVAALVYADGGQNPAGKLDSAALELLVAATSAWLEVASLRKQAAKGEASGAAGEQFDAAPVPVNAVSSYSDPDMSPIMRQWLRKLRSQHLRQSLMPFPQRAERPPRRQGLPTSSLRCRRKMLMSIARRSVSPGC